MIPPYTAFGLELRHLVEAYELYCRGTLLREVGIFLGKYAVRRITHREVKVFFRRQGWELFDARRIAKAKRDALKHQANVARLIGVPFWVLAEACLMTKPSSLRILVEDWLKTQKQLTYPEVQKLAHFSYPLDTGAQESYTTEGTKGEHDATETA